MTVKPVQFGIGTHLYRDNLSGILSYAVERGLRIIDTAPNYGGGNSHRVIGSLRGSKLLPEAVTVNTKVGFLPSPRFHDLIVERDFAKHAEFVDNHLLTPEYVRFQTSRNAEELSGPIDCLFLHNPERQLERLDLSQLLDLIRSCFEVCEEMCSSGLISSYGISSWRGFFAEKVLDQLWSIAYDLNGNDHHFKSIQAPLSLIRSEELIRLSNGNSVFNYARALGLLVYASSPLQGGELPKMLEAGFVRLLGDGLSPAQASLQFVRSSGLVDVVLVGCSTRAHVDELISLAAIEPLDKDTMGSVTRLLS
jgi:aryl-alcohol dehydrogenase-like predicted oxidoreductase